VSGIGFGLFQSVNVRAVRRLDDVYVSTFLQLLIAAALLLGACIAVGDLPLLADASAWALISFGLAGLVHFFLGWTRCSRRCRCSAWRSQRSRSARRRARRLWRASR
jgi:O-antigen/teichoic acid export membrane protein